MQKIITPNLVLLAFLGSLFIAENTISLPVLAQAPSTCRNFYVSGYGAAYDLTGGGPMEVVANCAKATPTLNVGRNVSNGYIYKVNYIYQNNAWQPFNLTSSSALQSNSWYSKFAPLPFPPAPLPPPGPMPSTTSIPACTSGKCQLQAFKAAAQGTTGGTTGVVTTSGGTTTGRATEGATGGTIAGTNGGLPGSILPPGNWIVAFNDEFNGNSIDTSKWNVGADGSLASGGSWYVVNSTIVVSGGVASLPQYDAEGAGKCSGCIGGADIGTPHNGVFGPGYYEARVQIDPGGWGGFWISDGWGNTLADAFEADILEFWGCRWQNAVHWGPGGNHAMVTQAGATDECGAFHIWGMLFDSNNGLTFYVDGAQTYHMDGPAGTNTDFGIVLDDMFMGGGTQPMLVDWVRYYKPSP
jgi:hypothetical protein